MVRGRPESTSTSVTITVQRTLPSPCDPLGLARPAAPTHPVTTSTPPKPQGTSVPTSTRRVPNSQPDQCAPAMPEEFGRAYSQAEGFAGRDQGTRTGHLVPSGLGHTEITVTDVSSPPLCRSCIRLEVPLRSVTSVLFLNKSLDIPLGEPEGSRAGPTTLRRSTVSIRFDKQAQMNAGYGGAGGTGSGRRRGRGAREVRRRTPERDVESRPGHGGTSLGLLSFRGPTRSDTNAGGWTEDAEEAAVPLRSESCHRQRTIHCGPDFRTWTKSAGRDKTEEPQKVSDEESLFQLNTDSLKGTPKNLSLKEALELLRPDFISRSQARVRRLERRAGGRRYLLGSNPDLAERGPREGRGQQNRNCTTPDPLSDNLFKPRERTISGKEMQRRSRRIYNQLPEVTKKKEEEKKKAVSQTNRLRADVYKKRLLDQILQR